MGRRKVEGVCCICGSFGPLTYEHIPPEAAFNRGAIREADVEWLIAARTIAERRNPPTRKNQRGAGRHTLCGSCNSKTGAWYVPAYVHWAAQGWRNAYGFYPYVANQPFEIEPLAVAKQLMAMFASACGPGFFEKHPDLVRFVLNRSQTGLPPEIRLFAYYVHAKSRASRQSGITGSLNFEVSRQTRVFSEIAFRPFGYVMSLNSPPPDPRLVDITDMASFSEGESRTLSLTLPALRVNSLLPGDFRSDEEIDAGFTD
jgi:hypothetical protein